jgi:hypothetical protein
MCAVAVESGVLQKMILVYYYVFFLKRVHCGDTQIFGLNRWAARHW